MKFRCDRDDLSEALQTVQRAVSSRPGIPALAGVLMNASGQELVLANTDHEVSARLRLGSVQVQQEGVALVPARLLAEKVKMSGGDQQLGPLNPYERRLVHMVVAEVPGVTTESVGDAFSKTVLISLRK